MIRLQVKVIQSVLLLSILQAVFSKRCSHSLHQSYLGHISISEEHRHCGGDSTSTSETRVRRSQTHSNSKSNIHSNRSLNSYYLRKRGLAFVHHSKAKAWKYMNSSGRGGGKSLSTSKSTSTSKSSTEPQQVVAYSGGSNSNLWFKNRNVFFDDESSSTSTSTSRRSLLSFNLNDVGWNSKKSESPKSDKKYDDEVENQKNMNAVVDMDVDVNANANANAVGTLNKDNLQIESTMSSMGGGDQKEEQEESGEKPKTSKDFPFASLINVEALLMASGQLPSNAEVDPGTSLLMDMMSEVSNANNLKNKAATGTGVGVGVESEETNDRDTLPLKQNNGNNNNAAGGAMMDPTWDNFVRSMQQNVKDLVESPSNLKEATQSLESFVNEAAASFSPERVQGLIRSVALDLAVDQNAGNWKMTVDRLVAAAEKIAREQGLDVSTAADQARATTKYTTEFLQVANGVLLSGYVADNNGGVSQSTSMMRRQRGQDVAREMSISLVDGNDDTAGDVAMMSKPLFHRFPTVASISDADFHQVSRKGAEMAKLSGAIYQDTIPTMHALGHSMVHNATTANVRWMVSDSVGYESDFETTTSVDKGNPILVRTITIRGFDASDEDVDRELLLNNICAADPVLLSDNGDYRSLRVHRGLLGIAKEMYQDILPYIDTVGPSHKIVLTGHSIGGALANLVLFLLTAERGNVFVQDKVKRVYTYGSPPIAIVEKDTEDTVVETKNKGSSYDCSILDTLGLPHDMVFGYIQPLDPIVRFFSRIDALYPLIGDLGSDGITLYASGPPRTLRPVTRTILESWENWPAFRDNYRGVLDQNYSSTGIQHLLMPDAGRYLADRLVNVNINAYEVDEVLRISSDELYDALVETFPLDIFQVSLVPTAIRSFIHHFFPAYSEGFEGYVSMIGRDRIDDVGDGGGSGGQTAARSDETSLSSSSIVDKEIETVKKLRLKSPADQLGLWVLGGNEV